MAVPQLFVRFLTCGQEAQGSAVLCAGRMEHLTHTQRVKMQLLQLYRDVNPFWWLRKELTVTDRGSCSNKTTNHNKSKNAFKAKESSRIFNSLSGFCIWFSHQKSEPLFKKQLKIQNHVSTAVP